MRNRTLSIYRTLLPLLLFPSLTMDGACGLADFWFLDPFGYPSSACTFGQSVFSEKCNGEGQSEAILQAQLAFAEDFNKTTPEIQISLYTTALAEDLRPVLPAFNAANIPTFIVIGTLSTGTPAGASEYLHANITNSTLVTFTFQSEQPQITDFVDFNNLFAEFLKTGFTRGTSHIDSIIVNNPNCCVCPLYVPTGPAECPPPTLVDKAKSGEILRLVKKVK